MPRCEPDLRSTDRSELAQGRLEEGDDLRRDPLFGKGIDRGRGEFGDLTRAGLRLRPPPGDNPRILLASEMDLEAGQLIPV